MKFVFKRYIRFLPMQVYAYRIYELVLPSAAKNSAWFSAVADCHWSGMAMAMAMTKNIEVYFCGC
jgi:hypothetical protein